MNKKTDIKTLFIKGLRFFVFLLAISSLWSCSKEYDLTIVETTMFEGGDISAFAANAAWETTFIKSDNPRVELKYSKCLEKGVIANLNNGKLDLGLSLSTFVPTGASMIATVYTDKINDISLNYGSTAEFDGKFQASTLNIRLVQASSCRKFDIAVEGDCSISLDGSSVLSDYNISCTSATIAASNTSHIAGILAPTNKLEVELKNSSRFVNYQSAPASIKAKLETASLMNITQTLTQNLDIEMSASEASVKVNGTITGRLSNASTLYYTGNANISLLEVEEGSKVETF